jgi:hypothetical protein
MTATTPEAIENHKRIDRERKARREREAYRNMTPEQRKARQDGINEARRGMHYVGNGIPCDERPLVRWCKAGCGARLTADSFGDFCDFICAHNFEAARPVRMPEPFLYAPQRRMTR